MIHLKPPKRKKRWPFRLVAGAALVGWAATSYVVLLLSPDEVVNRAFFLGAVAVALSATFAVITYGLSFVLFSDVHYKGNLGRSSLQGAITALLCVAAAVLQLNRELSAVTLIALTAVFVVAQAAVLLRE